MKINFRKWICIVCLVLLQHLMGSWGFFAHKLINESATFSLPPEISGFFKEYIQYITEHAVDPDKRCYIDTLESPRHFIDIDDLHESGVDSVPIHWSKAKEKFSERKLRAAGIIPWQIDRSYTNLRDAMYEGNLQKILRHAADLGHYVGDAHVPLHTTKNYNGQFTNQIGIHAFWETRLPERFSGQYNLWVGKATYIASPLDEAWEIIRQSHALIDSVLSLEQELNGRFARDQKYAYVVRQRNLKRDYSEKYAQAYHQALNGMVERRLRASIRQTANFWYSAWIDAGQPDLSRLINEKYVMDTIPSPISGQKSLGRQEWH